MHISSLSNLSSPQPKIYLPSLLVTDSSRRCHHRSTARRQIRAVQACLHNQGRLLGEVRRGQASLGRRYHGSESNCPYREEEKSYGGEFFQFLFPFSNTALDNHANCTLPFRRLPSEFRPKCLWVLSADVEQRAQYLSTTIASKQQVQEALIQSALSNTSHFSIFYISTNRSPPATCNTYRKS